MSMFIEKQESQSIEGVVEKIIYENEKNGFNILTIQDFEKDEIITVTSTRPKIFEGMSIRFYGTWMEHKRFGKQFKSSHSIEIKPRSKESLIRFFSSGLISGIGEATAKRIVNFFGEKTLDVFEKNSEELLKVPGIAAKTLKKIQASWDEHKEVRDTMLFLQDYKISPLFALKIFKFYKERTIEVVSNNPYQLIQDISGVGFLSADKIALNMGIEKTSPQRIHAAISFCLESYTSEGHCHSSEEEIIDKVKSIINIYDRDLILASIDSACNEQVIKKIELKDSIVYAANKVYYAEKWIAKKIYELKDHQSEVVDSENWFYLYENSGNLSLSEEQKESVDNILKSKFSILTGGPGCGKTTTTKALVFHLKRIGAKVLLAAPTGRAAQRMSEVIGFESQTIHRLLEFSPQEGGFTRNSDNPLEADFILIDEASMLDVFLASALLKAVNLKSQLLFIGDPDQLPSVGPGNVLKDLIDDPAISSFKLNKIFRQAESSDIVSFAHKINQGEIPQIVSPLVYPKAFKDGVDCLFLDSDQATKEQMNLIHKLKKVVVEKKDSYQNKEDFEKDLQSGKVLEQINFKVPKKFENVDFKKILNSKSSNDYLRNLMKKVHPWSSLNYGKTADEVVDYFYKKKIPSLLGPDASIQILSPQKKGSLGTNNLNQRTQALVNPPHEVKKEIKIVDTLFREGDRVIQTRNNYNLEVFNGDIGEIYLIENNEIVVDFGNKQNQVLVMYQREDAIDLKLAYAITIHKSQGSEFDAVIIPIFEQHYNMLFRNLIYTGLTRAKKLAIFVGTRKALAMAISNNKTVKRRTLLPYFLKNPHDL